MIPGCILSGGKGRRIGGQGKAFINLSGKPLIYHSIENIKNQVTVLSINARNNKDYNSLDYPVILDEFNQDTDGSGPLAGILTAINWAKSLKEDNRYVATIPVDLPFLPKDFINRMLLEINIYKPSVAVASSNNRLHPVAAVWSLDLADRLRIALIDGTRKIDDFTSNIDTISVDWKYDSLDPFFNVNTPEDLSYAENVI